MALKAPRDWEQDDIAWFRFRTHTGDDFCPYALGLAHQRVRVADLSSLDSPRVLFADGTVASVHLEDLSADRAGLLRDPLPSDQETPAYRQETWLPGEVAWFEYHCNESNESPDAPAWYRSHQQVTVLNLEEPGSGSFSSAAERGEAGDPVTYRVRFADGLEWSAFEDELFTSQEGFHRPSPPHVVRDEPVDLAGFARLSGLALETLRTYRKGSRLPEPDGTFGKVAWWYASSVQVWQATRPGRWPKG